MLNAIIRFSIQNKLIIGLMITGLVIWGSYSVTQLPIDAVPDITNNQVQVITVAPSQSALDIERYVTFPVEQAMATIPQIEEVRSFCRSGISVVTIVFSDDTDVYWARQQVSERLAEAKKMIPADIGVPEVAPITTGLGEIYQYTLKLAPGYEKKYSIMELRTIQDWIVRRQLLGTEGVAEVSSFGGYLKQYEIAINSDKLRSLNLSVPEIIAALSENNENTGGAYIEQNNNAYFIRSEGLLTSIEDIESITIRKNESGTPLLMRDVAVVHEGHAVRYGALTQNGLGESVGAIVMMLKGANSSYVIARVKERIKAIEATLPEGVSIEPFLDRTKLVNHAINTVTRNLAEGALIVIFVLVLLLGNFRAGLVVASVIPLAMLFAVIMMNLFHVSGNLMSLGAIDFGLIVDGAVIIVEATLHHITVSNFKTRLTQGQMDEEVHSSARKMMSAAAFGQIIIFMVYLPILSLVGIEGKMFRPMAQTVIFAIIGAFILSLTYVPMASALFLSKSPVQKKNISDRMLQRIHKMYEPVLQWSLSHKSIILSVSVVMLVVSVILFSRMGGEFLPKLDEGDYAIETRLLTGTNLSTTVEAALKGERILLKHFPEVEKVVSKIGTSEVPLDPMSIEQADIIVVMKDKSEWKSAETQEEMVEKMQAALQENLPGVSFGFQYPIQMRFNELMTGARQDVVVKVYGEDLDVLTRYASQIGKLVNTIEGTEDLYLEPVTGAQQIVVRIKRNRLALFGVSVNEVNQVINAGLAGQTAGTLFDGEKRFDIVVRLDDINRKSIEDVRSLYVTSPSGEQIPITQVADVTLEGGPSQIQRDDTRRRIVVGFNVRGRDVESIVNELQGKVNREIKFPTGYRVTYGGAFENLIEAKGRLSIAVPVALLLILLLLYFTFGSLKQGLLIYTAIPLSAIGGVFALLIRGMPFSISAGVGFIALFGVAVLNGIVLISEFNRLKKEGIRDIMEIIMKGTSTRLRPVLMTATVASLGFLPMALSHGSGAEVQKPLATVVIGGLISATLLTLIVLPVLYLLLEKFTANRMKAISLPLLVVAFVAAPSIGHAQTTTPDLSDAIHIALERSPGVEAMKLETEKQTALKNTAVDIPKTDIYLMSGQYNSIVKTDNNISVNQTIPFPTVFVKHATLNKELVRSNQLKEQVTKNDIAYEVRQVFNKLLYHKARHVLLLRQDSLLQDLLRAASLQYKTGEGTLLSQTMAETQHQEMKDQLMRNQADIRIALNHLRSVCQAPEITDIDGDFEALSSGVTIDTASVLENPLVAFDKQLVKVGYQQHKLEAAKALPDLHFGYFNQTLIGTQNINGQERYFGSDKRFQGFQAGLSIPLWISPFSARIKAAKLNTKAVEKQQQYNEIRITQQYREALQEVEKNRHSLEYYKSSALKTSDLLMTQSQRSFESGEVDYASLLLSLRQALAIRENYLSVLHQYNMSIIVVQYLSGLDVTSN